MDRTAHPSSAWLLALLLAGCLDTGDRAFLLSPQDAEPAVDAEPTLQDAGVDLDALQRDIGQRLDSPHPDGTVPDACVIVIEECTGRDPDCSTRKARRCDTGAEGLCAEGLRACNEEGTAEICIPRIEPAVEICDALDNDCDGRTDEETELGTACSGRGECGRGTLECRPEAPPVCSTEPGGSEDASGAELNDGLDNDCDGAIDEA